jgi:hypothetical protein
MSTAFTLIGFILVPIGLIWLLCVFIRKLLKKPFKIRVPLIILGIGMVTCIVGIALYSDKDQTQSGLMQEPSSDVEKPVIVFFNGSPLEIRADRSSTLSWQVDGATSVNINNGIGTVPLAGSEDVSPPKTTVYKLTASNAAGKSSKSVTIVVSPLLTNNIKEFVVPNDPQVRDSAISIIQEVPPELEANMESWKIWQINYWTANNISYVSDPRGQEYIASAAETLEIKGGDCDDFAVLLASLYEAVGLDAIIASVDTDNDGIVDHLTCLVYYDGTGESLVEEIKVILQKTLTVTPTNKVYVKYWEIDDLPVKKNYTSGIWVVADPPMAQVKDMVGYVTYEPYKIVAIVDVGS